MANYLVLEAYDGDSERIIQRYLFNEAIDEINENDVDYCIRIINLDLRGISTSEIEVDYRMLPYRTITKHLSTYKFIEPSSGFYERRTTAYKPAVDLYSSITTSFDRSYSIGTGKRR